MSLSMLAIAALSLFASPIVSQDRDPAVPKPTLELSGSINDQTLQADAPANGVIVSQKAWDALAKAWGIKDAPKVDFAKELLIVGTWKGSVFNLQPMVKEGDLTVGGFGTKDLRPGFRWRVQSMSREGIKTVLGKELPKE